ncbi:MAG: AAA family ATPase [Polyangiaceae bacterium]
MGRRPPIDVAQQEGLSLPRVMRVYSLERPLSREERFAEMALAPSDLMGRDAEKADLHAAYHRAMAADGANASAAGTVVARAVVGEVGIGKTALVEAFLAELPPEARALRVEVIPARAELPFSVVGDLIRDSLSIEPRTTPEEVANQLRGLLEPFSSGPQSSSNEVMLKRLVEIATGKQGEVSDEDELGGRDKLVGSGVRRMLASMAMRQPLVLVIDGIQWSDTPSLELMHGLLRRADPIPILVLLVTRPDERVLPYLDGVVRIDLRGLSRDDQVRLVEARLGVTEGVAAVCDELVPRVAGNPFFLLEMIDALLERGALELQASTSSGSGNGQALVRVERPGEGRAALPSTLEQIISDRLRELPPEERLIVDWLAVARGPLSHEALEELTRDEHHESVMRLCARGVCDQRGDSIDLRHTIARDVAYAAIDVHERRRMHQQLGEYLAESPLARGLSAALVAWHLARGPEPLKAADHYLEAAQAARGSYQMKHALRYFRHVLRLVPEQDPRRLVVYEALETLYRVMGKHRDRRKSLADLRSLARDLGNPKWVAIAFVRSARFEFDEGQISRGLADVERGAIVANRTRATAIEVEAYQLKSDLLREAGDMAGALQASDRAIELASEHPESTTARARAEALRSRGIALRYLGRVREAVEAYAEAIAVFRRSGARRQEARAKNSLAFAMFVQERWEDTIALALDSIQIDRAIGGRFQIAKTLSNIGQSYARLGDTARALAYLKRAREAHERFGDQDGRADTLLCSAEVMIESGDLDSAHVFCGDASALNSVSNSGYDVAHEKLVRALLARKQGDHATSANMAAASRAMAAQHKLVSFGLYASAIEAAALAELNEGASASALALSALDGLLTAATEYSLEIRALACIALDRAKSNEASLRRSHARKHAESVGSRIRDERLRLMFRLRPIIIDILGPVADLPTPSTGLPVALGSGSISPPSEPISELAPEAVPGHSPLLSMLPVPSSSAPSSNGPSSAPSANRP